MKPRFKTLFESLLVEARADDEYAKSFSQIDRDIFDKICLMDPKTQRSGNQVINIGFGAKQLLLPKYIAGEVDFIDKADVITSNLELYYPNIKSYPKFPEFESVASFLKFMESPVEIIDAPKQDKTEDRITDIYNKYYSDIPREDFNKIISLDPQTDDRRIGDIAKNLILRCYRRGDKDFLANSDSLVAAIERFLEMKDVYEVDKQNLMNYPDIQSFISYIPPSPILASLAGTRYEPVEGRDFTHIATTKNYDVFKLLTYRGSERLAHARGAQNVWCTAGGADGLQYQGSLDHSRETSYWQRYSSEGSLYMFLHKSEPTDRTKNFNMSYKAGNVYEFRDGNNNGPFGGWKVENNIHKDWEAFLLANPEVVVALASCNETNLKNDFTVNALLAKVKYSNKPYIAESIDSIHDLIKNYAAYKSIIKYIEFRNIPEIPAGLCNNYIVLEKIVFGPGLKTIGMQAFKNCPNLSLIEQNLPDTLEVIEEEAFMGCRSLKGSIHLPESLNRIKIRAFDGTRCKLKIDVNRKNPITFASADRDWVKAHVMSIKK